MNFSPRIQLVNSYPPPTAVWRIARLIRMAVGEQADLATICVGNLNFDAVDTTTSSLHGNWPLPSRVRSVLNTILPGLALRSLTSKCRRVLASDGIVHYLSEDIRPWVKGNRVAVLILGNPMATLESERYYRFSEGYKMAVRINLRRYSRFATCVTLSEYVRRGLQEFGYDAPIRVVPPAIDPTFQVVEDREALRRRLHLPTDRKILLSISTGERRKNIRILPRVMDLLPPEYLLVRVGPPVRGCYALHDLSDEQLAQLYSASDALLFPTLEEGFGLPVIEAFASGLPVVSSDISVIREVANDAAELVDPADPAALARACTSAIQNREEWKIRGLRRAEQFTVERFRSGLSSFYQQVGRSGN
jgi:glycosyltransferase involved in cell wall biosynthesis